MSETRRRRHTVTIRLLPDEHAALGQLADTHGLSVANYARAVLLDRRPIGIGPTHRRVPAKAERALSRLAAALSDHTAELNKIGSNVNQLAHRANAGISVPRSELAKAARALERMQGDAGVLRAAVLDALGLAPSITADQPEALP